MKKLLFSILVSGLVSAGFCQHSIDIAKIDSLLNAYAILDRLSASVLVAQNGKILLEKGYGQKNADLHQPNDRNSIFRIYSITKIFTSVLILKLAEENKLTLQDKLSKYYSDFPSGDSITIFQLLSHTAGIYDYTHGNDMKTQSEAEMIRFLKSKRPEFTPGTQMSYSNSGYWLLGFIIEKTSGLSYARALEKYIFKPAGMKHSGLDFKWLKDANRSTGYSILTSKFNQPSEVYDPPGPYAAGAIHATVGDLYVFSEALLKGKIISTKSLDLAQTSVMQGYGLGWIVRQYDGKKMVSHSGGGAGFRSNFVMIPEERIFVTVLANSEMVNTDLITTRILDLMHGKNIRMPKEIPVAETQLQKYVGTFETTGPELIFYIDTIEGRLQVQVSKQTSNIVYAETPSKFFAEEAYATIEFLKDSSGSYNRIEVIQRESKISGKRINAFWGLLGDAVSGSWDGDKDIQMSEDSSNKNIWVIKNVQLKKGEIKFRFNKDWTINYGMAGQEGMLERDGKNISVEGGVYDIEIDLNKLTYTIIKR